MKTCLFLTIKLNFSIPKSHLNHQISCQSAKILDVEEFVAYAMSFLTTSRAFSP